LTTKLTEITRRYEQLVTSRPSGDSDLYKKEIERLKEQLAATEDKLRRKVQFHTIKESHVASQE
jgi:hypothetical protein